MRQIEQSARDAIGWNDGDRRPHQKVSTALTFGIVGMVLGSTALVVSIIALAMAMR